jgi:hypothetical protein
MKFEHMVNLIEEENVTSTEMVVPKEVLNVKPLAVHIPIVDWFTTELAFIDVYKIIRSDGSYEYIRTFQKVFRSLDREDLIDMYQVGKRKYADYRKMFDLNSVLFEKLLIMFEPEGFKDKIKSYNKVRKWELHALGGVYYVQMVDEMQFYLVETEYEHNLYVLLQMLKKKLVSHTKSDQAQQLVWKITRQVAKFRDQMYEDMRKFYAERDAK